MNWSNVYQIEWNEDASGKHKVCYSGSRSLPAPYVGNGSIMLTDDELKGVYLILRREESLGIPIAWSGGVVTQTRPRRIVGLDAIAKYFSDEALKKEDERMKNKVKDLELRLRALEVVVEELLAIVKDGDVTDGTAVKENGDDVGQDGEEK